MEPFLVQMSLASTISLEHSEAETRPGWGTRAQAVR